MEGIGWLVKRADEIVYPKQFTETIFKEILTSDLVIADLTDLNPNVLYEVGLTHAVGNDLLLLTQGTIPSDLKIERTVFYNVDNIEAFKKNLKHNVGSNLARH